MIFSETPLKNAFVVDVTEILDDRGFFAWGFWAREFEDHGLKPAVAQVNLSFSKKKRTIRGHHYRQAPATEAKPIRCFSGAIYEVIVDLRPCSPIYLQHFGIELSAQNKRTVYVPELFAHGYLTYDALAFYPASKFYTQGVENGIRYDDHALGVQWPIKFTTVSEKDTRWP